MSTRGDSFDYSGPKKLLTAGAFFSYKKQPMQRSRFLPIHFLAMFLFLSLFVTAGCAGLRPSERKTPEQVKEEKKAFAKRFQWWPTDAKPAPYEDPEKGGYWWWPQAPAQVRPYGNRGYVFIQKIIFDEQGRPYLIIKRIERNVKIYFDFDKSELRKDALPTLENAIRVLEKDPTLTTLLTGNADIRGTEQYNLKLGTQRAESIRQYLIDHGVAEDRIKILSRGKLDAVAPVTDLVGMQKDRNVPFVVAEVEEVQVPESQLASVQKDAQPEGKTAAQQSSQMTVEQPSQTVIEEVQHIETPVRVQVKQYVVQKNDSLWKIAEKEYGDGNQWRRLYEYNRDKLHDAKSLKPGQVLEIPIE